MGRSRAVELILLMLGAGWSAAAAQDSTRTASEAIRIFLDCHGGCDSQYLRTEINYVNWVLDRADADVHLLVTSQETGGGGRLTTLKFIGLRKFQGVEDELTHAQGATETEDERRRGQAQVIRLGLVRYLARTPAGARLAISMPGAAEAAAQGLGLKPKDPWNNWVFEISGSAFLSGESSQRFTHLNGGLEARRVTDQWKLNLELEGSRNTSRFTLPDSTIFTDRTNHYQFASFLARSLGDHWSVGGGVDAVQSTRSNYDLALRVGPALEYNVFKYAESTRKSLVAVYELSAIHFDYTERTLYDQLQEILIQQTVAFGGEARQPWGEVSGSLSASTYLSDLSKNRFTLFSSIGIRLTKGLDLNLFGEYTRIHDQLNIPAAGASRDEILRQLRELQTGHRYAISIGLTYRFGSIYNNVVNPRLSSREGGGRFLNF